MFLLQTPFFTICISIIVAPSLSDTVISPICISLNQWNI